MAKHDDLGTPEWLAVIGRSLAYLCIHRPELQDKNLDEKSKFLLGLGLPLRDCAALLDTTEASLRVLSHYHTKKEKGGKRVAKKSRSASKRRTA